MKIERLANQFRDIAAGVTRKVLPNKKYAILYSLRTAECGLCEHSKKVNGVHKCSICGCFIPLKVRSVTSTNNCPLDKWVRSEYFGKYKYDDVTLRTKEDLFKAIDESADIYRMLKKRVRKLCTRAQYSKAFKMCLHYNKITFEAKLSLFMEESQLIRKSKYRAKNQYQLECSLRELNTMIKTLVILTKFRDETYLNVEKNQ